MRRCPLCREDELPLERIRSAVRLKEPVRRLIHQMKYEALHGLADPLAELMAAAWPRWEHPFDLICPIPLHRERQRERGYNQAELLAQGLGRRLERPVENSGLVRQRQTPPQVGLARAARKENMRGAFRAKPDRVAGQRIMLVDDVLTSGATLAEAAAALLGAGATTVSAYCLATAWGELAEEAGVDPSQAVA